MSTDSNLARAGIITGMITGISSVALSGTALYLSRKDRRESSTGTYGGSSGDGYGYNGTTMLQMQQRAFRNMKENFNERIAEHIGDLLWKIQMSHGQHVMNRIICALAAPSAVFNLAHRPVTAEALFDLIGGVPSEVEVEAETGPRTLIGKAAGYVRDVRREVAGRSEADEAEEAAQQRREAAEQRRAEAQVARLAAMAKIEADARKSQLDFERERAAIRNAPQARPNTVPAPAPSGPSPEVAAVLTANAQLTQQVERLLQAKAPAQTSAPVSGPSPEVAAVLAKNDQLTQQIERLLQAMAPAQPPRSPAGPPAVRAHHSANQGAGQPQGATSP